MRVYYNESNKHAAAWLRELMNDGLIPRGVVDERSIKDVSHDEQVESKDGRLWLSGVRSDLETLDYAVGAADLCAAGVSAPQKRQRLYWVAWDRNAESGRTPEVACINRKQSCSEYVDDSSAPTWNEYRVVTHVDGFGHRVPSYEFGIPLMVDGFSGLMALVRGAGNAIVPQVAAEFVAAFMDIRDQLE